MTTAELRKAFLDYFQKHKHTVVPSSPLVPGNDPTLLFTNAGMVQFKETFLGLEKRPYTRAVSAQRCVRAGGKHNDLENVGYTSRHHTFFEMLGNFSFGDYFKREAIQYAWDFLRNVLKVPAERLWITVYEDDVETADIWLNEIKIDPKRFSKCGEKHNFWSMGDTGPCGPCTEIYYDHGSHIPGAPPGTAEDEEDEGERYVEIWNLVFMQYDRAGNGTLTPLPKPSVDTGGGLERLAAMMQGVHSNYDIDIFQFLIKEIAALARTNDLTNKSLRVVADHIRACAFLIADGVMPSNEGRGYVLRRICRRAIRHGHRLGFQAPFFYKLVQPLAEIMGDAYPEIREKQEIVEKVLHQEELQFARTLEQGLRILEQDIENIKDGTIPGDTVFRLYDTYGFPVDLTADIARERGLAIDMDGFDKAMAIQRTRAREASQFAMQVSDRIDIAHSTEFTGYALLEEESRVLVLLMDGQEVSRLEADDKGIVVLDHTPFYAEAGGQVGDQGRLEWMGGEFEVLNTKKFGEAHAHFGVMKSGSQPLSIGSKLYAAVDIEKRRATERNHSATHLLHAALRQILGNHVQQKGSLVEAPRLRFDFSHIAPMTMDEIRKVEELVNDQILENSFVVTDEMSAEEAKKTGAMALFGEKYGEKVRVLRMGGDFSVELCGGTHVKNTAAIGLFKIVSEAGIAGGIRRIVAVTGKGALEFYESRLQQLQLENDQLKKDIQQGKKEYQKLKQERLFAGASAGMSASAHAGGTDSLGSAGNASRTGNAVPSSVVVNGITVITQEIPEADPKILRDLVDRYKSQHKAAVIVLASRQDNKVSISAGITKAIAGEELNAGDLVKDLAKMLGGTGGGRPDMAQGGGNDPSRLGDALESVTKWVEKRRH